jgi:2'-5' RNA ligase superfamily protein
MRPGDRLVCAFVDRLAAGGEFKQWPLHVTLVPWFRVDMSSEELAKGLKAALAGMRQFEARVGRETTLGHGKTVNLIQAPAQFEDMELSLRSALKRQQAWLVDETTKRKSAYKPHVTALAGARVHENDSFWCDRLYLIEQTGAYKTVQSEIPLE